MHNPNYGENTVNEFVEHVPTASEVFRSYDVGIPTDYEVPLAEAAQSVSATPEEMLAVMEYRARRAAQRNH
jgi:iron-sulfur cluster repair protein YtfE (RIC family)